MTTSEDVSNLFRKFGGQPEQYQELSRDAQAEESKARWPLLASLRLAEHAVAPSVRDGRQPVEGAPVPNLRGRERAAGVSPFAPVPEVTLEAVRAAAHEASLGEEGAPHGSVGRTLFSKTAGAGRASSPLAAMAAGSRLPGVTAAQSAPADRGARALAQLAGAADAAGAASIAGARDARSMAAPGAAPASALSRARRGDAAPAGPRPLSAVFAKLAGEPPAADPAPGLNPQKTSLFARLSRL
ncbi:cellulose biosynthesis protein BcsP [Robbsia sp. Bb-Pol-6]|uniref:Cellulose biosynthesis protein BcsP n=1 Tax=Robbsia betulipollinis TaxID=2981849 RepID=A0ABT3ZNL2_9BURK|nr:cellulose biosynthesis protein BcsP [Robbsia betulipollinis]MCY0387543.1 cellulose biosynthesis protein BcsP [Robbsia betulipollinis]